jgi:hypothetical protein
MEWSLQKHLYILVLCLSFCLSVSLSLSLCFSLSLCISTAYIKKQYVFSFDVRWVRFHLSASHGTMSVVTAKPVQRPNENSPKFDRRATYVMHDSSI